MAQKNVWTFKGYGAEINRQMIQGEKRNRRKAVSYLSRKLRLEVKKRWGKNNLYEGIGHVTYERESRVGFHKPAQHAHLLEFGTDQRFVKNYMGKDGVVVSSGAAEPKPFFRPLLQREKGKVEDILSEPWVK